LELKNNNNDLERAAQAGIKSPTRESFSRLRINEEANEEEKEIENQERKPREDIMERLHDQVDETSMD
jgi:hypothetical protein